jgi:uncharacterized protein YukE
MQMLPFDYINTIEQAKELHEISNDIKNTCIRTLGEAISCVRGAWDGPASQVFLGKCDEIWNKLDIYANNIQQVAEGLEKRAK